MTDVTDTLHVTVRHPSARVTVIAVTGDVDLHTSSTLRAHALPVLEEQAGPHLVLDLTHVDFFDSTGLSTLIGLLHAAHGAGGSLSLASVPDRLMRMITMTGISQLLPIHATVADALAGQPRDEPADNARTGTETSA
ncbi:STAS domain-containing protein [Streptomyces sp. NPDC015171]|uniref:STAS domain-containing protein n=1 Tax=Streptomyces sp. NPDC015171 TaxID=3364945 RepID=UPI0036FE3CF5